ncbi:SRPBCC family protein [Rugamonas sp. CCM 8940]|uniref:SRPBCC family protein n=1 Tax=Rugamonas sp. CCM 8940 TaxID=2765359 RepID=UPI0018F518CC|nr:SRPBCC family protein [Rugamonas sp. CCM 8940]MBJ7312722.1 SRPBCC family protein [Rugamonas sp. CCM 8940]
MSKISVSIQLAASAERVWQMVGGFNSMPDWCRSISNSTLHEGGRVRRLETADGAVIVERLETFSEAERRYSYSIVAAPLPVTNYHAALRVGEGESACAVEWSSTFYAAAEDEERIVATLRQIYQGGLDDLKRALGA